MLIRKMDPQDIRAGLRLCRVSGWNQLEDDWSLFLRLSPAGCCVAEKSGQVVGSVATLRYQDRFSWLSMVLVHPQHRRAGIGTLLLSEGLALLPDETCVRLDATPPGRAMYLRHGFLDEHPISRLTIRAGKAQTAPRNGNIRRMTEQDFRVVLAKDRRVFGADREAVLRSLFARSPECACVAAESDTQAYCFGRPGFLYRQIGPIVSENEGTARELVAQCISHGIGQAFGIDTPQRSPSWLAWLLSIGFVEERSFVRMYRGEHRYSGIPEHVYAIVGPEFG